MRTLLICHTDDLLARAGLAPWLASFSDLRGMLLLEETRQRKWKRVKRELKRVGPLRFLDVLAYRLFHAVRWGARDSTWARDTVERLRRQFGVVPADLPCRVSTSPNTTEAKSFVRQAGPDLVLARCKTLISREVFSVPRLGTFVLHPGICPEYRNAHGGFWALANGDGSLVGVTMLKIDEGVDTGPVFGYFHVTGAALGRESHFVIQERGVFDNLDAIRERFEQIAAGRALPLDTLGRESRAWGQPWLTSYIRAASRQLRLEGRPRARTG
jgi:hypothetical protein